MSLHSITDRSRFPVKSGVVASDWQSKFPDGAAPYTTTMVFLVRKGDPKGIKDWDNLVKPGISTVVPNPKTSGNGRYSYLAAWGYALESSGPTISLAILLRSCLRAYLSLMEAAAAQRQHLRSVASVMFSSLSRTRRRS